ncbi:MAG: mandelate racemase/muconate lactonizing enzyme family protein [Spirochaetales bacterium]|jgi:cis-L-3-hydroxyproline dehydratase|nr:mandelate racemase/muconate lactonizing enzyme family protein [Spirochaetales bacterium]
MKIRSIEIYGYDLSYRHGSYVMSGNQVVTDLPCTVVRLITEDGIEGWGEVCPLGPLYLASHAEGARAAIREMGPGLLGVDPTNLAAVHIAMDGALRGHSYAKCALDVACWDILGKATGKDVATLLGGRVQETFPLYMAIPLGPAEEMRDYLQQRREEGIHRFQLKIGANPYEDAERVRQMVEATDDNDFIVADANGGWCLQDAMIAARLIEPYPRVFFEEPCKTLEECLYVRQHTNLPMVLDEVITDVGTMLRAFHQQGMEAINLKISKFGGLTGSKLVRDIAEALGLRVTIEDTWGGDLVTAAVSHLAASTKAARTLTVSFMNDWTNEHVAHYQPRSQNGVGHAPTGPGLGVDVDIDQLGEPLLTIK